MIKNLKLFWFLQLITFVIVAARTLIKLSKVEVLWEGHTILWNHQLRFDSEVNIKSKVEILQNLRASQNIWTLDIISYNDLFCCSDPQWNQGGTISFWHAKKAFI